MTPDDIRTRLFEMQDTGYRDFHAGLMPGVPVSRIIGVRFPQLRAFAKEVYKSGDYSDFLTVLPHEYYDEMNLHGFIISLMKEYDEVIEHLDRFLPYVDNWATCDLLSPKKAFKNHPDRLIRDIRRWMDSPETYVIRFGMEMLMTYFLDEDFDSIYLQWVADIASDEYYVNMMRAWFMATALAKQYEATVPYIEKGLLDDWTLRKTVQKARESYRVTDEHKEYLRNCLQDKENSSKNRKDRKTRE